MKMKENKFNEITKKTILILLMIISMIITMYIISRIITIEKNDQDYFSQYSQNKIDECYNTNNNNLECYKLCREHKWIEDFCLKRHNKTIS